MRAVSAPNREPLAYQLNRLLTILRAQISSELNALGLPFTQYVCLQLLRMAPHQSNAELARALGVSPQATNRVLQRMQRGGLVDRPDSASWGRVRPASLTTHGRTTLDRAEAAVRLVEDHTLSVLTAAQCSGLRDTLLALAVAQSGRHAAPSI